jgi:DNA-binding transcriptional ArsR family regulator
MAHFSRYDRRSAAEVTPAQLCLDRHITSRQYSGVTSTPVAGPQVSVFDVVAEPRRRRILDLLRAKELPVGELVAQVGLSQPAVSKHLRVLRDAGLVAVRSDAQRRLYRLRPEPLTALDDWLTPYRALWEQHLDDLERHLAAMPDEPSDETPEATDDLELERRQGEPE